MSRSIFINYLLKSKGTASLSSLSQMLFTLWKELEMTILLSPLDFIESGYLVWTSTLQKKAQELCIF